jgi:hypothetical protein
LPRLGVWSYENSGTGIAKEPRELEEYNVKAFQIESCSILIFWRGQNFPSMARKSSLIPGLPAISAASGIFSPDNPLSNF